MRQALSPALTNLLIAFAIAQSILYSSLMPLWEGFDEPWHYGYVQALASGQNPVLAKTYLSEELWQSMLLSPGSYIVQRHLPELRTFDVYFGLSPQARAAERRSLESIPPAAAGVMTARANYEIQQAPLAYVILAPVAFLLRNASMPVRILWLRMFNAILVAVATLAAGGYLFRAIGLTADYQAVGLFCIFACQMYWATAAHIANDGIALALSLWFFGAIAAEATPRRLAVIAALGLLVKAYFLPLAAFAACLVAWRKRRDLPVFAAILLAIAGPWYARNLVLYHDLSGLQMSSARIPVRDVLVALAHIDWTRTIPYMLRATLWTGNNSFTSFNAFTLNSLLALLALGLALLGGHAVRGRVPPNRRHLALLGALAVFAAAVLYVAGNDVIWLRATSAGPCPWYTIPLFAPLLGLSLLGMSRTPRLGRTIAAGSVLLSAYICIATYVVKLIPLYGGYPEGRSTLSGLSRWYATQGRELTAMLSTISLAPPVMLYLETGLVSVLAVTLAAKLC